MCVHINDVCILTAGRPHLIGISARFLEALYIKLVKGLALS